MKPQALFLVPVLAAVVGGAEAALVAHYDFTAAPGATAADEAPGADGSNDITVNVASGSPVWLATEDGRAGVMRFTNEGSLILNPPSAKPSNGGAFTVALWTKANTAAIENQFSSLFSNGAGGTNHFQIDADGTGNWRLFGGSFNTAIGAISEGWTHIAVTHDGTTTAWYYNGNLVNSGAGNPGGNFDEFRIATNRANDLNGKVNADIDDVRIYDEALDATAVAALAVPEPSALLLVFAGLGTVFFRRRA